MAGVCSESINSSIFLFLKIKHVCVLPQDCRKTTMKLNRHYVPYYEIDVAVNARIVF